MAKQGKGILTAPPAGKTWTGQGRSGYGTGQHGSHAYSANSSNKKPGIGRKEGKRGDMPYLNKQQNASIRQRQGQDIDLGNIAGNQMEGIEGAYSQPFNWDGLPSQPVQGDFNDWRQGQIDSTYGDFTRRLEPQFKQEIEDFDQTMANRGVPVGSELYNKQRQLMEQGHDDARSSALVQAQGLAGQNAGQFFDIGSRARGTALNEGLMQRNMPLSDYNQLMAARSPYDLQNLGYSQQRQLQKQGEQNQRWLMQHTPRGGGGGGGGGGSAWQEYGFSTPQEYDAYQDARKLALAQAGQPKQPNPYAGLAGGILGGLAQGWASSW